MSHYFETDKNIKLKNYAFKFIYRDKEIIFHSSSGVFSKKNLDFGSELLLSAVPELKSEVILDLGSGIGAIGISVAKIYPETKVYLREVNEIAVRLSAENIKLNNLKNVSFLTETEVKKRFFNVILFNPPIRCGKKVYYELFKLAQSRLTKKGYILAVIRTKQGAKSLEKFLAPNIQKVLRKKDYIIYKITGKEND